MQPNVVIGFECEQERARGVSTRRRKKDTLMQNKRYGREQIEQTETDQRVKQYTKCERLNWLLVICIQKVHVFCLFCIHGDGNAVFFPLPCV